jgi:DNA-binding transcriptional MerR regulator
MQLMSIGRFSRLTGLGVKALRHYDDVGLLKPAAVDEDTGYRLYAAELAQTAEEIRRLRRLELPLDDIRALLETRDPAAVREILVGHQRRTALRSARTRSVLQGLQTLIDGKETVMGTAAESLGPEAHRRLGIDLFNRAWTLMEDPNRDPDELLHCVHASAYHWMHGGGTPANRARSEWQCSRVYAVLGRSEPSLRHARRCLDIVESSPDEMEEFDLPFACEALARAHALAGNEAESREWLARARAAGEKITDEDDRVLLESDLATITP